MQRGLTLIEALVIAGLTLALLLMLLPIAGHYRGRALEADCMTNLGAIGPALAAYSQDYDGAIVPAVASPVRDARSHLLRTPCFADLLAPYTPTPVIWQCPHAVTDLNGPARRGFPAGVGPGRQHLLLSYAGNDWLWFGPPPPGERLHPKITHLLGGMSYRRLTRLRSDFLSPRSTILLVDGVPGPDGAPDLEAPQDQDYCGAQGVDGQGFATRGRVSLRHSGGFNALFAGGGARWLLKSTPGTWAADPHAIDDPRLRTCPH